MKNDTLNAMVILETNTPETVARIREELAKLGFAITYVSRSQPFVTIHCRKEHFERVFATKVAKVPARGETGNFTPEHYTLTAPVTIPEQLKKDVKDICLPQPPTFF